MRPEDERPDDAPGSEAAESAGEGAPEAPPPATWAGRRRAGVEAEDDTARSDREPKESAPDQGADGPASEPGADAREPKRGADGPDPAATQEFDPLVAEERADGDQDATDAALAGLRARTAEREAKSDTGEAAPAETGDGEAGPAEAEGEAAPAATDDGEAAPAEAEAGEAAPAETDDSEAAPAEAEAGEATAAAGPPDEDEAARAKPAPVAAAAESGESPPARVAVAQADGKVPHAKRLWARFLAAALVIVISMAAATSISLLVYLTDIAEGLGDNDALASLRDQLADVDGGSPQTILILGSDKRAHTRGDPGRSDTTLLLRVDPDQDRIALLSIPRDLKVTIPNYGVGKFNEAYTVGGARLTTRVVKQLTGLEINHVVNINFTGFADAVNAIGGVYVDVDRQYYVPEGSGYSAIDPPIEAGYQLMKGLKALQYVRFRHDDNDLVRSARQQDFMREARQKLPAGTLIRDRNELLDIFTEYTTSDIGDAVPLLELLKTFAAVQSAPVVEVHFPADLGDGTSGYVTASDEAIKDTVAQFLATEGTPGERPAGEAAEEPEKPQGAGSNRKGKDNKDSDHFVGPAMEDASGSGEQYAEQIKDAKQKDGDPMITFPIYYPTRLSPGSTFDNYTRAFPIDGPGDDVYHGYKFVAEFFAPGGYYEYYGISGTDWVDAPILANASETRTIEGRDYLLFYDGDRLRQVGWKTDRAAYWVSNSLLQALDEGQMLSIATSMRELGK